MPETNTALFVAVSLAVIAAPGSDNIYVLTRGVAQGRKVVLASAWGMCSGLLSHTTLATLGLSAILARSAMTFSLDQVRWGRLSGLSWRRGAPE